MNLQIAAIMGNMYAESGMNPGSEEGGGTNANGIGLCQWTNGRHTNLVNYASPSASPGRRFKSSSISSGTTTAGDIGAAPIPSGPSTAPMARKTVRSIRRGNLGLGKQTGLLASTDLKDAVRQFCYGWEGAGIPAPEGAL